MLYKKTTIDSGKKADADVADNFYIWKDGFHFHFKTLTSMDASLVIQHLEKWQRSFPESISEFFNFYNKSTIRTERVVSFQLSDKSIGKLLNLKKIESLRILMGGDPDSDSLEGEIPEKPIFTPILHAYLTGEGTHAYTHCFPFTHLVEEKAPVVRPNSSRMPTVMVDKKWITKKTAQLFMATWLEVSKNDMAEQFQGTGVTQTERVRSFSYLDIEKDDILDTIKKNKGNVAVYLHMGMTVPVQDHPFGFRPIIEIKALPPADAAQADNDDSSYYEFSSPCPPNCQQ